jgi:hypothetical protein
LKSNTGLNNHENGSYKKWMLILLQLLWSWLEHNMVYGLGNKVHEGYAKRLVEHTAYVKRETLYEIL